VAEENGFKKVAAAEDEIIKRVDETGEVKEQAPKARRRGLSLRSEDRGYRYFADVGR
jgi:hypothetical protein